jgi:integral membrane protein (TIGR00529 family)
MVILEQIPAMIRIIIVFVFMLFLIRKKLSLGHSFILGAVSLSVLFGLNPRPMIVSMAKSIVYPKTLSLALIVSLILVLSSSMELSGQMKRLLQNFRGLIKNIKINLIVFPALIGLLPMPGGAVFSAPMVKDLGTQSDLSGDKLSFINYWFRHIWEYWWPLYPGVLLATVLANINILNFMAFMCPITILALYFGYLPLKDLRETLVKNREQDSDVPVWPFFKEMTPILLVIIPGLGMGILFSYWLPNLTVSKEIGLILALVLSIGWIWFTNTLSKKQIWKIISNLQNLNMMYIVASILIFKGILEDSHAVGAISNELLMLKVPLMLISIILPFLVGLITGITIAFVGVTLPILIPLIHSLGESGFMLQYVMLTIVCGFSGVLLSPLHLCFILSNEYFNTSMSAVYRHLWLLCACLICSGVVYFLISHWILKLI